jgi:hypothetical protein
VTEATATTATADAPARAAAGAAVDVAPADRKCKASDLEVFGMQLGVQAARRLIRGYAVTALQPDPSPIAVGLHFQSIVEDFVRDQRATNGLTDAGEAAYRRGYRRGLESQMKNPEATIQIETVKGAEQNV